jgi:DNA mismatch repair ATPase MutS
MRQLDEEIGDLESYIKDTEDLIKSELEDDILDSEGELRSTFSALAELDCILSLTSCAADLDFSRPEIVLGDAPVIYIENGRHPLQELIIEGEFVKNDTLVDQNSRECPMGRHR